MSSEAKPTFRKKGLTHTDSRWTRWRGYARQSGMRFWMTLVGLGVLRVIQLLPYTVQLWIGKSMGWLTWRFAAKPRKIVRRNIEAYFSNRTEKERREIERQQFLSLGLAIIEVPFGWWSSRRRLAKHYTISGMEHVEAARARGRGVLLLGFHFTTVELCGIMMCQNHPIFAVYRPYRKNPLADEFTREYRSRIAEGLIERDDVKTIARRLREKNVVFFAGDMLVRPGKRSEVLPFFGVPTYFHSGALDLARMTGSLIVPYFPLRKPGGHYEIEILPALEGLPSADRRADMQVINTLLEKHVLADPSQYLWARDRLA